MTYYNFSASENEIPLMLMSFQLVSEESLQFRNCLLDLDKLFLSNRSLNICLNEYCSLSNLFNFLPFDKHLNASDCFFLLQE